MTNKTITLSREALTVAIRLATRELETLANGSAIERHKAALAEFRAALAEPAQAADESFYINNIYTHDAVSTADPVPPAFPSLQMIHVIKALESVRGTPVLTSNQCHDLAQALNDAQRAEIQPVPPAGGEAEVLIDQLDDYIARINGDDRGSDATVNELRAHVTRLQAEVKRLDLMVSQADYNYDEDRAQFQQQATELQSELTKARELIEQKHDALRVAETYVQSAFSRAQLKDKQGRKLPPAHPISADLSQILAALSNQSAPADKGQGEAVAWSYCPECGCEELHHEVGEHKQCANCHQEWFSDIDYSDVVRGNLQKLKAEQPAPVAVVLPERKPLPDLMLATYHEAAGWNACLDELTRLNPIKQ